MTEPSTGGFRSVAASAEIANDTVLPHYLSDRKVRVAIARVDDHFYAFDDLCTCGREPCPLSGGLLTGRTVMCQCHGSRFDITTGAVINGPATEALTVYAVREIDGEVQVPVGAETTAERSLPYFGRQGGGTDLLKLLAWTGVVVAVLLPVSRKLARRRERSVAAGTFGPAMRHAAGHS